MKCAHGLADCGWCWPGAVAVAPKRRLVCPACGRRVRTAGHCDRCKARRFRARRLPFRRRAA